MKKQVPPIRFYALLVLMGLVWSGHAIAQTNLLNTLQSGLEKTTGGNMGQSIIFSDNSTTLTDEDITAGLREALRVGTERVVTQIGAIDGYNADPTIHIPLPANLQKAQKFLEQFGLSSLADEVELKMNRAAEAAAPQVKSLIWESIANLTLEDAHSILNGPKDAATRYFRQTASDDLADVVRPVMDQTLAETGAISAYEALLDQTPNLPFMPDLRTNLTDHATKLALEGVFHYLAQEEAAIRQAPVKRTTKILRKVFGS